MNSLLIFYQQEKLHSFHRQYLKGYLVCEYCLMPNKNLDCKRIASKRLDYSAMAIQYKYHQVHQRMEPPWMYFVSGHQLLRRLNFSWKFSFFFWCFVSPVTEKWIWLSLKIATECDRCRFLSITMSPIETTLSPWGEVVTGERNWVRIFSNFWCFNSPLAFLRSKSFSISAARKRSSFQLPTRVIAENRLVKTGWK